MPQRKYPNVSNQSSFAWHSFNLGLPQNISRSSRSQHRWRSLRRSMGVVELDTSLPGSYEESTSFVVGSFTTILFRNGLPTHVDISAIYMVLSWYHIPVIVYVFSSVCWAFRATMDLYEPSSAVTVIKRQFTMFLQPLWTPTINHPHEAALIKPSSLRSNHYYAPSSKRLDIPIIKLWMAPQALHHQYTLATWLRWESTSWLSSLIYQSGMMVM